MKIDTNLISKAKSGDTDAFSQLYGLIYKDLYKTALYSLQNTEDAHDAVSETFLEAYKGIHQLRDESAFRSWMFKILSARCKRKISRYIIDRDHLLNNDIFEADDFLISYSQDIDSNIQLKKALADIKYDERIIVLLSVIGGYTTLEISKILNRPHGTICSKLHRTLKKLRDNIEKGAE